MDYKKNDWISPGGNTPQSTNYTATCPPSRKLYMLDEPDTLDTTGEAETSSYVMYSCGGARGVSGGACGVMVIVVGNGHGDTSSNPGPG